MMTTDELIQKNSELQKQLNPANQSYYGDLVVYLRAKGTFKNELVIEEKAFEILQDILESQAEGIDAEEYFGKQPKEIADELIQAVPISIKEFLKLILSALGAYTVFSLFPALVLPSKAFDVGAFAIVALYSLAIALLIFWLVGTNVYQKKKKLVNVLNVILLGVLLAGGVLLLTMVQTPYQFRITGIWGILTILILLVVTAVLFFKQTHDNRKLWAVFIPAITSCAIIGIFSRITMFSQFFETMTGRYIVAAVLVLSIIIQYLLIYLYTRKPKKSVVQ
ncbi:hypothetical protein [Enterococcus sp. LJL90]